MMNLLESAGFSRANPYYVVQQGKVSSVPTTSLRAETSMTDARAGACTGCYAAVAIASRLALLFLKALIYGSGGQGGMCCLLLTPFAAVC